jgi:hypothetical protein
MRAQIHPGDNFIQIDGEHVVAIGLMPVGPDLPGFVADAMRPIEVIHYDGAIGMIQRRSRAPGRNDVEHFLGPEPLKPYVDVFNAERARIAEEKAKRDQEQERIAQHAADLAGREAAERDAANDKLKSLKGG